MATRSTVLFVLASLILPSLVACEHQEQGTSVTLFQKGPRPLDPQSEKGIKMKHACDKCHAMYPSCESGMPCARDFNTCTFHEGDVEGYCKL